MNFSVYCVLAASAVLIVLFTPQSNADRVDDLVKQGLEAANMNYNRGNNLADQAIDYIQKSMQRNIDDNVFIDATRVLGEAYLKGVQKLLESEDTMVLSTKAAGNIIVESPEAAKRIMMGAFNLAEMKLFESGNYVLKACGFGVALSNNATRPGLENACKLILKAGFAVQDSLTAAESLFNQGINAGGRALILLMRTIAAIARPGYAGAYNNNQISVKEATQTLRNARNSPQAQDRFETGNCTVAEMDPDASRALKVINESANMAIMRGAKPELVEEFRKILECSLGDFVIINNRGVQNFEDVIKFFGSDPEAAIMRIYRQAEIGKESLFDLTARIFAFLAENALKAGNRSSPKIDEIITMIELGKVKVFTAIDISGESIINGMRYKGETLPLSMRATFKIVRFAKQAFIEILQDAAIMAFSYVL